MVLLGYGYAASKDPGVAWEGMETLKDE